MVIRGSQFACTDQAQLAAGVTIRMGGKLFELF